LTFDGAYLDLGVDKAGGTNHLLDEAAPDFVSSYGPGVADTYRTWFYSVLEFFKCEWTIVQC